MARQATPRAPRRSAADRILDAALTLAAETPWRRVSMGDIARAAGLKLSDVYREYPSKPAICGGLIRRTDLAVLEGVTPEEDAGEPVVERLHDVLMRRFDALGAHKAAVRSIARDTIGRPWFALCAGRQLVRSMAWSLEAAGIRSTGPDGHLKAKALALIYLDAMRVWLNDDAPDAARTMARLDRSLRRADSCMARFARPGRRAEEPAAA